MKIETILNAGFTIAEWCIPKAAVLAAWLVAPAFSAWIGCRGSRLHLFVFVISTALMTGVAASQNFAAEVKRLDRLEAVVERQASNITAIQLAAAEHKFIEMANTKRLTDLEIQTAAVQTSVSEVRGGVTALQWLGVIASIVLGIIIKWSEIVGLLRKA